MDHVYRSAGSVTIDLYADSHKLVAMSLQSTIGIAKLGTKSLRTTVPEGIVAFLGLQIGDKLDWRMEVQNGERVVIVRKADNTRKLNARHPIKRR